MAKGRKTGGGSRKGKPNRSTKDVQAVVDAIFKQVDPVRKAVEVLNSGNVKAEVLILLKLFEYRYGKPVQPIEGTGDAGAFKVIVEHIAANSAAT